MLGAAWGREWAGEITGLPDSTSARPEAGVLFPTPEPSTQAQEAVYLSWARHAPSSPMELKHLAPPLGPAVPRRAADSSTVPCPTASRQGARTERLPRPHQCPPPRPSPPASRLASASLCQLALHPHLIRRIHLRLGRHQPLHHLVVPFLGGHVDRGPSVLRGGGMRRGRARTPAQEDGRAPSRLRKGGCQEPARN